MEKSDIIWRFRMNEEGEPDKSTEYLCQLTADQLKVDIMDVYDALVPDENQSRQKRNYDST